MQKNKDQIVFNLTFDLYSFHFENTVWMLFTPLMHPVTSSPQMPQVMDSSSEGIDLHFWGRVLKAASEKIHVVSAPKSIYPSPLLLLSSPLLLGPAGSEAPVFLALQETRLFRCSLFEHRSQRRLSDGLNNVGCICVC